MLIALETGLCAGEVGRLILALLKKEQDLWNDDLERILREHGEMPAADFADAVARSLESGGTLLKIMAMDHYDMEENSRLEQLSEFKATYGQSLRAMRSCLEKLFPDMGPEDIDVKTRCIVTVASTMASGITDTPIIYHLNNAKAHGVTRKEIAANITHAAFYIGWPKAWNVFNLAKEIWKSRGVAKATRSALIGQRLSARQHG